MSGQFAIGGNWFLLVGCRAIVNGDILVVGCKIDSRGFCNARPSGIWVKKATGVTSLCSDCALCIVAHTFIYKK